MELGTGGRCAGLVLTAVVGGVSAAVAVLAACCKLVGGVGGAVCSMACKAVGGWAGGNGS